jgi:cation:H+ antiporter
VKKTPFFFVINTFSALLSESLTGILIRKQKLYSQNSFIQKLFFIFDSYIDKSTFYAIINEDMTKSTGGFQIIMEYIFLVIGFVLLIKGADFFVDGASSIAGKLKVPSLIIGLTVVSIGTSLPEAAVSISASLSGTNAISLGNVIGSNIFNITFILGLSSMVVPLTSSGITPVDYAIMIAAAVLTLLLGLKGRIGRAWGAVMIVCFVVYNCYLVTNQID